MCVEDLGRDSNHRMSFDLKISVLFVCRGEYVIDKLRVAAVMKNKLRAQRGVYFS